MTTTTVSPSPTSYTGTQTATTTECRSATTQKVTDSLPLGISIEPEAEAGMLNNLYPDAFYVDLFPSDPYKNLYPTSTSAPTVQMQMRGSNTWRPIDVTPAFGAWRFTAILAGCYRVATAPVLVDSTDVPFEGFTADWNVSYGSTTTTWCTRMVNSLNGHFVTYAPSDTRVTVSLLAPARITVQVSKHRSTGFHKARSLGAHGAKRKYETRLKKPVHGVLYYRLHVAATVGANATTSDVIKITDRGHRTTYFHGHLA